MHPPFYTVDHKVGPDIHHAGDARPSAKRNKPAPLRMAPATTGWPPVPLLPSPLSDGVLVQLPTGPAAFARPHLRIVPPPRRTIRDIVGRWLIRLGQRMILQNRPG